MSGGGGVPWVAWRRLQPRTWFYPGVRFNLPIRFLIPDTNPDPVPAGDWGAELRGSFVNSTSQRQLQFVRLHNPVLAKGVLPFSPPLLNSIARARPGIAYLGFCPLKKQTAKNISLGRDSAYRDFFLILSHLTRSAVIGSYLYESASASPILTSMMAST